MKLAVWLAAVFSSICLTQSAFAQGLCSFKSGDYINELSKPSNILSIDIKIPKAKKFVVNGIRMHKTVNFARGVPIPENLKRKRFRAKLVVNYPFGQCRFSGTVRQSGDFKDHIEMRNGKIIQSLDIKLKKGNILNAVRFKLLIPKTRHNLNEIFGTVVSRKLGFITPETFQVDVSVNDTERSLMIFQENARKELLERNKRREGPILEGDEELLWKGGTNFYDLALSRLSNPNWLKKGNTSASISIMATAKLQHAYIRAVLLHNQLKLKGGNPLIYWPNRHDSNNFKNFNFLMISFSGWHALRGNNRRYYYSPIDEKFEPIYYDGGLKLGQLITTYDPDLTINLMGHAVHGGVSPDFLNSIIKMDKGSVRKSFMERVAPNRQSNKIALEKSFDRFFSNWQENVAIMSDASIIDQKPAYSPFSPTVNLIEAYIQKTKKYEVSQKIISSIILSKGHYDVTFIDGTSATIRIGEVAEILSRNKNNGQRTVYVPKTVSNFGGTKKRKLALDGFNALVVSSSGIKIEFDEKLKLANFVQSRPEDWVLIKNAEIDGWTVVFDGAVTENRVPKDNLQRFNDFGLTGCLNFLRSNINNSNITAVDGGCEDSINLISSSGKNVTLHAKHSSQDAIDLDFSDIDFELITVEDAGNDCLDVSGGSYTVNELFVSECSDKGLSVGEASHVSVENFVSNNSKIGFSFKDHSVGRIYSAEFNGEGLCGEVVQKKQEFGGAKLTLHRTNCIANYRIGINSTLELADQ